MQIIRHALPDAPRGVLEIVLFAERLNLAKTRWRGVADDGREFGFELEEPLHDGAPFFMDGGATYIIAQRPEPVLELPMGSPGESAWRAWLIGNLRLPLQVAGDVIRVADVPALREMLQREQVPFTAAVRVFHPLPVAAQPPAA